MKKRELHSIENSLLSAIVSSQGNDVLTKSLLELRKDHWNKYKLDLVRAVNDLSDAVWNNLHSDAIDWFNSAAEASNRKLSIPDFGVLVLKGEEPEPKPEPIVIPPAKKQDSGKPIPRNDKRGATYYIREMVCNNPNITKTEVMANLRKMGFETMKSTMTNVFNNAKSTVKIMSSLYDLTPKK
jgi:hypothetical protein